MAGSKRFEIDLGVNASGAVKGANDAAMAFADLEDAVGGVADESRKSGNTVDSFTKKLVDAAREAGKSDDEIRDALRNYGVNAKDAERAIGRVGDSLNDLEDELRAAQRQSEKLGDSVDDFDVRGRKAFGGVAEGAKEVTQEVGQNLGQAVSSFRGDLADLGQVGQDTLGGLAATIAGTGPAGIAGAAGIAAGALGLGLVTAEIQKGQKEAEILGDRLRKAYEEAAESGAEYISIAQVIKDQQDLMYNDERATEWAQVQRTQKETGLEWSTVLRANAGDLDAINVVQRELKESADTWHDSINDAANATDFALIKDHWKQVEEASTLAGEKQRESSARTSELLASEISKYGDLEKQLDNVGNQVVTLPDGKEIFIDAKTGQASENLTRFKGDADGVIDHVNGRDVVIKARVDTTDAGRSLARFINQGRQIKIGSRVVGPAGDGGWNG